MNNITPIKIGGLKNRGALTIEFNIFVSYSTKDREKIEPVLSLLRAIQDTSIFLSDVSIIPGSNVSQEIINKIKVCDLFLVFYSENSIKSTYVQQEIGTALGNNRIVIPILLDGTKPDSMMIGLNYLDLADSNKYINEINRLYSFVMNNVQQKKQRQAILSLGALLLLIYALDENRNDRSR